MIDWFDRHNGLDWIAGVILALSVIVLYWSVTAIRQSCKST